LLLISVPPKTLPVNADNNRTIEQNIILIFILGSFSPFSLSGKGDVWIWKYVFRQEEKLRRIREALFVEWRIHLLSKNLYCPKKSPCYSVNHGPCKIPLASATRLSLQDPWLSVPRLLVVWLYRCWFYQVPGIVSASPMPKGDISINLLILQKLIQEWTLRAGQKLPIFVVEEEKR